MVAQDVDKYTQWKRMTLFSSFLMESSIKFNNFQYEMTYQEDKSFFNFH